MLDSSAKTLDIQVGANDTETISINLTQINGASLFAGTSATGLTNITESSIGGASGVGILSSYTVASGVTTAKVGDNLLKAIDKALSDVDSQRSALGAIQNRFESTVTNLNNTITNLSAARSRIEDADYAVEVSNMTRAQILQQAGTSVLAQANQVPQSVLSLLG